VRFLVVGHITAPPDSTIFHPIHQYGAQNCTNLSGLHNYPT
jgi:hypothetical protein